MRALDLCLLALACLLMMSKEAKGGAPEFIYAIDNITVAAGREAQVKLTSIHLHFIICMETHFVPDSAQAEYCTTHT